MSRRNPENLLSDRGLILAQAHRFDLMMHGDVDGLAKVLDAQMTYVHSNGKLDFKQDFVDKLRAEPHRYVRINLAPPPNASVRGTIGVIVGELDLILGQPEGNVSSRIRFTEVAVFGSAGWQLLAWQSTRLMAPS